MLPIILDLHLTQFLGLGFGHLLAGLFFDLRKINFFARLSINLVLGCAAWVLAGIFIIVAGLPASLVFASFLAAGALLIYRSFLKLEIHGAWISNFVNFYARFVFLPFCFFLFFASLLLAQYKPEEINPKLDQWETARRVGVYIVPDHVLQWQISRNLYAADPLETGFRRHKVQIWSAGDRPILIGFLDATYSKFSGQRGETIYYFRIIFLAAYGILLILGWLRVEFNLRKSWAWTLASLSLLSSPFVITNVIYTWPKFAGLALAFCGIHILRTIIEDSQQAGKRELMCTASLAFALGVLCHAAAIYGALAGLLYFALTRLDKLRALGLKALAVKAWPAMLVFVLALGLHKGYLAAHTRPTGLLARVQFCRGGSYAHPTPVISLYQACKQYYQTRGLPGIVSDRLESMREAFLWGYSYLWTHAREILGGNMSLHYLRQEWDKWAQMLPLYSYGFSSLAIVSLIFVLSRFAISPPVLSAFTGFALLFLFASTLAQFEEMRSHVVPFAIPVFIWLGVLATLYNFWAPSLIVYSVISIVWQVSVLAERSAWMTAWQNPQALYVGVFLGMLGMNMAQRFDAVAGRAES